MLVGVAAMLGQKKPEAMKPLNEWCRPSSPHEGSPLSGSAHVSLRDVQVKLRLRTASSDGLTVTFPYRLARRNAHLSSQSWSLCVAVHYSFCSAAVYAIGGSEQNSNTGYRYVLRLLIDPGYGLG